jgi:hypothetical protein
MRRRISRQLKDAFTKYPPLRTILGYLVPPVRNMHERTWGFRKSPRDDIGEFLLEVTHADKPLMIYHGSGWYMDEDFIATSVFAIGREDEILATHTWMRCDGFRVKDLFTTLDATEVRYLILVRTSSIGDDWMFCRPKARIVCSVYGPPLFPDCWATLWPNTPKPAETPSESQPPRRPFWAGKTHYAHSCLERPWLGAST